MLLIYRISKKGIFSMEKLFSCLDNRHKRYELKYDLNSVKNLFLIFMDIIKIKNNYIHITGDVNYIAFLLFWKKSILTIHDLNHYEDLSGIRKFLYGLIWILLPIRCANYVTVVSPFSKVQLQKYFSVDESKIVVIPNHFVPIKKNEQKNKDDFFKILAIGSTPNKNINRLISAVKGLEKIKLIIVGKLDLIQLKKLNDSNIEYKSYFNISQNKLSEIYNLSDLLFFASTKEGFGLPILEAQSCGVPVITSKTTSMPYVAGNGAIIVNPYSIDEIKNTINKIITDFDHREDLIQKGFVNIKRFEMKSFIKNFEDLYNKLKSK